MTLRVIWLSCLLATGMWPAVTITLTGIGFTAASVVLWNAPGKPAILTPTLVSSGKLIAEVPAALLAAPGSAGIQVAEPSGDVFSVAAPFDILGVPKIASL